MSLRAARDRKKFDFFFWYATWEGVLLFSCQMLFIEKKENPLISMLYRHYKRFLVRNLGKMLLLFRENRYATWERIFV
ncbi:hypothetical protein A9487_25150 [Bacillus cereus]|nr:hypothetical protein A9487_25150 [Bacillus cereus]